MFEASHKDYRRKDWAVWEHPSREYLEHLITDVWGENIEHWNIKETA